MLDSMLPFDLFYPHALMLKKIATISLYSFSLGVVSPAFLASCFPNSSIIIAFGAGRPNYNKL
jgi:hypothetical protein